MSRFADLRGAGRRGRRIVLVLAVPLVLATLPAIAGAEEDGSAAAVVTDHRSTVESAQATAAAWNLDDDAAKDRDKALEHLDKALDPEQWLADGSGVTDDKVFKEMEKAVKELAKVETTDATWVISDLVLVAEDLAAGAIAAAGAGGADVEKAQKAFDQAATEDKNEKRIDRYSKAWKEAGKAVEKAAKAAEKAAKAAGGGSGSFGDDHIYDFTMMAADGVTTFVVHGTSGSNEGYLFDSGFGPDDTYMDEAARAAVIAEAQAAGVPEAVGLDAASGGVIQVHVSCSDAFPDGIGAKSDPAASGGVRVVSAHIIKGDKTCDVAGTGTPGPTSMGDTIPGSTCFDAGYPAADGVFYEFVFVPATPTFLDDGSVSSAETLTVCGQSDGNEGFLYDDAFAAADTSTEMAGQMQVHVSCSDAFAGGIGQKSDPTPDSQWLVNTAHIVKLDGGEVKKDCEVVGSGFPIGDPPADDPPADDPPSDDPPADDPPSDDPPVDDPPADDPPVGSPTIDLEKRVMFAFGDLQTEWYDADEFDPTFGAFPGSDVYLEFAVVNTGDVDLTGVVLSDSATDLGGCGDIGDLAVGAQAICTVSGTVDADYAGQATVSGTYGGQTVTDADWVYYLMALG